MTLRRLACAGFTLLEMLVVMLVIGLTLALVQINLTPGENSVLRDEMLRLEVVLGSAQDEVSAGGRPLALELTETGYRFYQRRDQEWKALGEGPLGPHRLAEGVSWGTVRVDGAPVTLPRRVVWQVGAVPPQMDLELRTASLSDRLLVDPLGRISHAASEAS